MTGYLILQTEYLRFVDGIWRHPGRKTRIVDISSVRTGESLGIISWVGRWRQYAFYPQDGTIWNPDCLEAVSTCIQKLMAERKAQAAQLELREAQ
jgi:hypothetical protein